jgi:hypothetical protein
LKQVRGEGSESQVFLILGPYEQNTKSTVANAYQVLPTVPPPIEPGEAGIESGVVST